MNLIQLGIVKDVTVSSGMRKIKGKVHQQMKQFEKKNEELLKKIEAIQDSVNTFSKCLSIKQCFGYVKKLTLDKKIEDMKPVYNEFQDIVDKSEDEFSKPMVKPIIKLVPEIEDLLNCAFNANKLCNRIVNGGTDLEMDDLHNALDTVHDILCNKIKGLLEKILSACSS